jgi:hypothetical protein
MLNAAQKTEEKKDLYFSAGNAMSCFCPVLLRNEHTGPIKREFD